MSDKKFTEEVEKGFKSGMHTMGIHSIGDFFRFGFRGAVKVFEAIIKLMSS